MINRHVDDFSFAGKSGDVLWESKLQAIREKFKRGTVQVQAVIEEVEGGFELSQPNYLDFEGE